MNDYISKATSKNWNRLNVSEKHTRLTHRANKTQSTKYIIPLEYISNKDNLPLIIKVAKCAKKYKLDAAFFSLGLNFLKAKNISLNKKNVCQLIAEYNLSIVDELYNLELPDNEFDVLGLIYQCMRSEGDKNINGAYYTPEKIINSMIKHCIFEKKSSVVDPCCGSGAFLMSIDGVCPSLLYGFDIDPIAVMITKFNLIAKFPDIEFTPNIICADFFDIEHEKYDYIITNPPWGAFKSKGAESFSDFIKKGLGALSCNGTLIYLLPVAFLYVHKYSDLRKEILENFRINSIRIFSENFSGVTTNSMSISISNKTPQTEFTYIDKKEKKYMKTENIIKHPFFSFSYIDDKDEKILTKIFSQKKYDLSCSRWGLGIVTGDNNKKLFSAKIDNSEKIYSGKNVHPFRLTPCDKYIIYNPENLQQAAPESLYRAEEKLVYKFISNKPVFAYDNTKSLVLNSANILIPDIPGMSIKTIMGFLNSELYQYIYRILFRDIKILKSNLITLPFPFIDKKTDIYVEDICNQILNGETQQSKILDDIIYSMYSLSDQEKTYIKKRIGCL